MGEQWQKNAATKDYVIENGAPAKTASGDLLVPAFYRLQCPKNKWMYAPPDFGSRLGEVKKNNSTTPHTVQLTETLAAQALEPIVRDGRASEVVTRVVEQGRAQGVGFRAWLVGQNGEPQVLDLPSVG